MTDTVNLPEKFKVSHEFRDDIMSNIILPTYRENIECTLKMRTCWTVTSNVFYILSTITFVIGGILAFSASSYPDKPMGFYAGMMMVIAGSFEKFSIFAVNQDHLKTLKSNAILANLGIDFTINDTSKMETGGTSNSRGFSH